MTQPKSQDPLSKGFFSNPVLTVFLGILLLAGVLLAIGLSAKPSLGDEIHHYRFAKNCFEVQGRALYDAIYASPETPGFFYDTEAAWPLALSWLWRFLGHVSFPAAQIYHLFYYAVLLLGVFRVAQKSYGVEEGVLSVLLTATMPMMVSFGILFYLDVPAAAASIWIFSFLRERRYWGAGFLMGLAYLIKKSTGFFVPAAFLWIILRSRKSGKRLFLDLFKVFFPAGLIVQSEEAWRRANLSQQMISSREWVMERLSAFHVPSFFSTSTAVPSGFQNTAAWMAKARAALPAADFSNSSIFNFFDMGKYFGVPLLAGLFFYFLFRRGGRKDAALWGFCLFFIGAAGILHLFPDIRYLIPIAPFLGILAARGLLKAFHQRTAKILIVLLCALQFLGAAFYSRHERAFSSGIQEGFSYMRSALPEDSLILYPETNILEYAQRRMIWSRMNLRMLFWGAERERMEQLLQLKIDYVAIKKTRIYDDSAVTALHVGKYPLSFVEILSTRPYAEKVFENSEMILYKIDRSIILKVSQ